MPNGSPLKRESPEQCDECCKLLASFRKRDLPKPRICIDALTFSHSGAGRDTPHTSHSQKTVRCIIRKKKSSTCDVGRIFGIPDQFSSSVSVRSHSTCNRSSFPSARIHLEFWDFLFPPTRNLHVLPRRNRAVDGSGKTKPVCCLYKNKKKKISALGEKWKSTSTD